MALSDHRTEQNILRAYRAGKTEKGTFRIFAEKADSEGRPHTASLFRAIAESEDIHTHFLLRGLRETSRVTNDLWDKAFCDIERDHLSTAEYLRRAIVGKILRVSEMYPQMIEDATFDGWDLTRECFTYISAVNEVHARLLEEAFNQPDGKTSALYFVCEGCGNTVTTNPAACCEICHAPVTFFKKVH